MNTQHTATFMLYMQLVGTLTTPRKGEECLDRYEADCKFVARLAAMQARVYTETVGAPDSSDAKIKELNDLCEEYRQALIALQAQVDEMLPLVQGLDNNSRNPMGGIGER